MIDDRRQEQASLYALGALPEAERVEFERALQGDRELRALVGQLTDVAGALATALPAEAPPPALKSRILQRIAQTPQKPNADSRSVNMPSAPSLSGEKVTRFPQWVPWLVAASFAAVCAVQVSKTTEARQREESLLTQLAALRNQGQQSQEERAALERALNATRAELAATQQAGDLTQLKIVLLESKLTDQPKAVAVSLWHADKREGILLVEGLAPAPAGKSYQLWVIDPEKKQPVDAGVFTVDVDGRARANFKPNSEVKTAAKFAVTLEREGGVPAAEGPMVLLGG